MSSAKQQHHQDEEDETLQGQAGETKKMPEAEQERQEALREAHVTHAQRERAGVSLESYQEGLEARQELLEAGTERMKTIALIRSLKVNESAESQEEGVRKLEAGLSPTLICIINDGIEINTLSDILNIEEDDMPNMNQEEERIAWEKVLEIANNPNSELAQSWQFENFLSNLREHHRTAAILSTLDTRVEPPRYDLSEEEYKESMPRKTWEWVKDHPIATGAIVLAGAVGISWLWEKFTGKPTSKVETAKGTVKWGAIGLGIAGGALALGAMLDIGGCRKWIRDQLHFNFSWKAVLEFLKKAYKGDWEGALKSFTEGVTEVTTTDRAVAEKIDADAEKISLLRRVKYADFVSLSNQAVTFGKAAASALTRFFPEFRVPFLSDSDEMEKQLDTEKKLLAYFERPEIKLFIERMNPKPETVGDVIDGLAKENFFGKEASEASKEKEDAQKPEREQDTSWQFEDSVSMSRLVDLLDNMGAQETSATLRSYEWQGLAHMSSYAIALDLLKALKKDAESGLVAVKEGNNIWLGVKTGMKGAWEGYKFMLLSSSEVLAQTFSELVTAEGSIPEIAWQGGKKYIHASAGFLIIGIGYNLVREITHTFRYNRQARLGKGSKIGYGDSLYTGVKQGVIDGLLMPVKVTTGHVFLTQSLYREIKEKKISWEERSIGKELAEAKRLGHTEQVAALTKTRTLTRLQRLNFYGEIFQKYNNIVNKAREGMLEDVLTESGTMSHLRKKAWKTINEVRINRQHKTYAIKFKNLYQEMITSGEIRESAVIGDPINNPESINEAVRISRETLQTLLDERKNAFVDEHVTKIRQAREMAATGSPQELHRYAEGVDRTTFEEMLKRRGIRPGSPEQTKFFEAWERSVAEQMYEGRKVNPYENMYVEGVAPDIELIENTRGGLKAKYLGMEIDIAPDEVPANWRTLEGHEAVRKIVEKRWGVKAQALADIEVLWDSKARQFEFRVKGQKVDARHLESVSAMQERYVRELQQGAREIPKGFAESVARNAHWISKVELVVGTLGAAQMIADIETSKDKKEAIIRQGALFAGSLGALKAFEKTVGHRIGDPKLHLLASFIVGATGGFLGMQGKNVGIIKNITDGIAEQVPGVHGVSHELGQIFEKWFGYKFTIKPLLMRQTSRNVLNRLATSKSLGKLGQRFEKSVLRRSIGKLVTKKFIQKVLVRTIGAKRAATAIAMFADDALIPATGGLYTPVALATDLIGYGLIAWGGVDAVQLINTWRNASRLEKAMDERKNAHIIPDSFSIVSEKALQNISEKIASHGGSIEDLASNEEALFDLLKDEEDVIIEFKREGIEGKERWTLAKGEATKVEVYDKDDKRIGSVDELDAELLEESMHQVQQENHEFVQSDLGEEEQQGEFAEARFAEAA